MGSVSLSPPSGSGSTNTWHRVIHPRAANPASIMAVQSVAAQEWQAAAQTALALLAPNTPDVQKLTQQLISTCKQLCEPGAQEVPWERLKLMQIKDKMLAKLQETGPS